jgi:phage tail sheath protein FI
MTMPNPTYPGVYVQEVASGVRPIEAVSTSTPAFVGLTEMGPTEEALRITSWTEYQRYYGLFINDGWVAQSVFHFFNNGGRQCYIVRVARSDSAGARAASTTVLNRAEPAVDGLVISARSVGAWGNYLVVSIEDGSVDPSNELKLSVRRQREAEIVPDDFSNVAPLEVHDNLSMDIDAPNYVVNVLNARSDLIQATVPDANRSLQQGLYRGGLSPTLPLGAKRRLFINVDHDGLQEICLPDSVKDSHDLNAIAREIQAAVQRLTRKKTSTPEEAFTGFTCTVEVSGSGDAARSRLLLQSGTTASTGSSVLVQRATVDDASGLLKLGAGDGAVAQNALAVRRPALAAAVQVGDSAVFAPVSARTPGSDGTGNLSVTMFQDAFSKMNNKTDFSLLAVPGENSPPLMDAGMAYCERRPLQDVFYVGETTNTDYTVAHAEKFRADLNNPSSYGALYFPWIRALDPSGRSSEPILLPPSGYIAGLFARTDASRGVWKAPAGTSATLSGAVGLAAELTDVEHGILNPRGVNVIRRFPTAGIVSFGARTVSNDAEWRYVPVRRLAIMLRVSIYYGIQWAVFEPNDELLWSQLRLNIRSFMMGLFRQGAFKGTTASEAFFVKCDAETTTQGDIDLGIVNVLLGFAPLKPAEFVIVKISQKAGQAA